MQQTSRDTLWTRWRARIDALPLRRRQWAGAIVCYAAFLSAIEADLWRPGEYVGTGLHPQVAEAQAWLNGRLDLDERQHDTALYGGKIYNVFPPAFTLISVAVLPWSPAGVPQWLVVALLVLPLPGLAYLLFLRQTDSVWTATLLTVGYLLGTSLLPLTTFGIRNSFVHHMNHLQSQVGLLIFLFDYFGRRRIWLGGVGLIIAIWSRQLTLAYAIPLVWMAWAGGRESPSRAGRLALAVSVVAVMLALPMTLNALKFSGPTDSGYAYIYEGRSDRFAEAARDGLFGLRFVPTNLYYMNIGPPRFVYVSDQWHWRPSHESTGIWWSTPLLLCLPILIPRIWRSAEGKPLLVALVLVWAGLLCYHTTGAEQRGYNRFSLDFVPVMLALIAPYCTRGWVRWAMPPAVAWSVLYFKWIL